MKMDILNISSNLRKISWLMYKGSSDATLKQLINDSRERLSKVDGFGELKAFLKNPPLKDAESFLTWAMILQHKAGF
jgi:hypothetical protein